MLTYVWILKLFQAYQNYFCMFQNTGLQSHFKPILQLVKICIKKFTLNNKGKFKIKIRHIHIILKNKNIYLFN
jgi:hypothetical protein